MQLHTAIMKSTLNIAIFLCIYSLPKSVLGRTDDSGVKLAHRYSRQADTGTNSDEGQAIKFLDEFNTRAQVEFNEYQEAAWAYESDLTDENQQRNVSE